MMASRISGSLIDRYAAGPSASRTGEVKALHTAVRSKLPSGTYETFLQGSYRNDTAIADINDVDIVALRKADKAAQGAHLWDYDFDKLLELLRPRFSVRKADKCVKLTGPLNADIVPAIRSASDWRDDPIAVYSRRESAERPNLPRRHRARGVEKNTRTDGAYKPTVRLFKRWVRQYTNHGSFAPSFYIECAVHEVSNSKFYADDLPLSFAAVGAEICSWTRSTVLLSVAGDKDVLVSREWDPNDFEKLQGKLLPDVQRVLKALQARTQLDANRSWKEAFGES